MAAAVPPCRGRSARRHPIIPSTPFTARPPRHPPVRLLSPAAEATGSLGPRRKFHGIGQGSVGEWRGSPEGRRRWRGSRRRRLLTLSYGFDFGTVALFLVSKPVAESALDELLLADICHAVRRVVCKDEPVHQREHVLHAEHGIVDKCFHQLLVGTNRGRQPEHTGTDGGFVSLSTSDATRYELNR